MGFVKTTKLIELYCTVCQCNDSRYLEATQRQSNNCHPQFSDEELITVYLWGTMQRQFSLKAIYLYTKEHLDGWFPKLPSYQAFCRRAARLAPAFRALCELWMEGNLEQSPKGSDYVVDSCPIILAKQTRSDRAKVGRELCDKTHNASRKEWYYGVKIHLFGKLREKSLPLPCAVSISKASLCDLWAAKQIMFDCKPISNGTLFADKAYLDASWKDTLWTQYHIRLLHPRKKAAYDTLASGDAVSAGISARRQPIESFFHWIHYRTNIQDASTVRSLPGLFLHIFAKLAAAAVLISLYY